MSQADDDEAKRALFVEMVRAALIVSHQSRKCDAYSLGSLMSEISILHDVSRRIPRRLSAEEAADEYVTSQFDEFEGFRKEHGYVHPKWPGLKSPAEIRALVEASVTETLIDGIWQVENPEWRGLPGNDSNSFKLLLHIRKHEVATMAELMRVLPHIDRRAILRALQASEEKDGLVEMTGKGRGAAWRATEKLLETRPASERPIAPPEPKPKPVRVVVNRVPDPHLSKVLDLVRRQGRATNAEIRAEFPDLPHYTVRRLLQQLRDDGLVSVEGTTKSAVWQPVKVSSRPGGGVGQLGLRSKRIV